MSFDLVLRCLDHGKVSTFPRSILEEAFAPFIESRDDGSWKLSDCLTDVWPEGQADCEGFWLSRQPGDEHHPFWSALLAVMRQTQTVLFWPSVGPKPHGVVAAASVIAHMPESMVRVIGTPKIVTKPEEFWEFIIDSGA